MPPNKLPEILITYFKALHEYARLRLFLEALGLLFVVFMFTFYSRGIHLKKGHHQMCEEIFREMAEPLPGEALEDCYSLFSMFSSLESWETKMNSWFAQWGWSHLAVYAPRKTKELWKSVTTEVGIKIKRVEGEWIVVRSHPDSPFEKGDMIVQVNDELDPSYRTVLRKGGSYVVIRDKKQVRLLARSLDYKWNDQFSLKENILKIPSFRKEFFDPAKIEHLRELLKAYDQETLYIDLKDNYGGNLGAGIIFLSLFFCEATEVGWIERARNDPDRVSDFPFTLDDFEQLEMVNENHRLTLQTNHSDDFCFKKKVEVLVNRSTGSTAEMVAQAFLDTDRGDVTGQPTSGQLVLSRWNSLIYFPEGYTYSYPIATYKTISGNEIEGVGVYPDNIKDYTLEIEMRGEDSFLF